MRTRDPNHSPIMPLSAEELVNALHEAAAAKNVDNFVAVAGVLEDQVDETFVQQKKGQLRRVIKLYRQIQKAQDSTPPEIARAMEALGTKIKSFTTPAASAPPPAPRAHTPRRRATVRRRPHRLARPAPLATPLSRPRRRSATGASRSREHLQAEERVHEAATRSAVAAESAPLGSTVDRVLNTPRGDERMRAVTHRRPVRSRPDRLPAHTRPTGSQDITHEPSRTRVDGVWFCLLSIIMESTVYASPGVAFRDWPPFHPREADASVSPGPVSPQQTRGTLQRQAT